MSDHIRETIQKAADNVENRRVLGIMRTTPGALGEPPGILDTVDRNTSYVGHGEIVEFIEREVLRKGKDLHKMNLLEVEGRVRKWTEGLTFLRKQEAER